MDPNSTNGASGGDPNQNPNPVPMDQGGTGQVPAGDQSTPTSGMVDEPAQAPVQQDPGMGGQVPISGPAPEPTVPGVETPVTGADTPPPAPTEGGAGGDTTGGAPTM